MINKSSHNDLILNRPPQSCLQHYLIPFRQPFTECFYAREGI